MEPVCQAPCFPADSDSKASACHVGDRGSISGLGRSPGEGNVCPFQHSCLENSMDRGVWRALVHGAEKSRTQLSGSHFHCFHFSHTRAGTRAALLLLSRFSRVRPCAAPCGPIDGNPPLQPCPTPCGPVDGSPPGSSVPGVLQARVLEWLAISLSKDKG